VVVSVSGRRLVTCASTLASFPDSLLGAMFARRNAALLRPDAKGEYFFDRCEHGHGVDAMCGA
jgi:hypothetical protein